MDLSMLSLLLIVLGNFLNSILILGLQRRVAALEKNQK